ncbi:isomerase [Corynebacterium yudongzhengii]|uniref:Peptidylprolyl isomerase n=1 Tax=Corynebacterium yudongzhengii TaxID=2080740 RepID=A0A2U1T7X6_9CORY|nr:peptidylprolyl isomerase [Corynebacterium yudongzhengii]AWB82958.1 isomerase [Corynebacterium yudongzhengii]PWC02106.1 peptidylprolyl isomerase [Corynebacterium yudongzhengii]
MSTNRERGEKALAQLDKEIKARDRKEKTRPLGIVLLSAGAIALIGGGIVWGASRGGDEETTAAEETTAEETTAEDSEIPEAEPLAMERAEALPPTVSCTYNETEESDVPLPESEDVSTEGTVTVNLETNQGPIGMELDRSVAPCTVNAITHLAEQDYFDNTLCHRLVTDGIYVLQCGDPTGTGAGGPGFEFANEYPTDEASDEELAAPVLYPRGSIAMANSGPDTNGSQFFLNYDDSPLPPTYTYFGQIDDEGLATLDSIAEAGVDGGQPDGQPAEQVTIESAQVE